MSDKIQVIKRTRDWIKDFVIQHNICPFARREFERDSILYEVLGEGATEDKLHGLVNLFEQLDADESIETSFLIFSKDLQKFSDYLDFLELSNALLHAQGYDGVYQLASFHPYYCFEGVKEDDPGNYSNRSPFPMLHILRESSLSLALETFEHPECIPDRNIEYLRALGVKTLNKIL